MWTNAVLTVGECGRRGLWIGGGQDPGGRWSCCDGEAVRTVTPQRSPQGAGDGFRRHGENAQGCRRWLSSVPTTLRTVGSSPQRRSILRTALMTVEWSLPPNRLPISGIAHLGQLAREVHRDHARVRDGAVALRPLEVVQLDVEVGGHLALDGLDGEAGRARWRSAWPARRGPARRRWLCPWNDARAARRSRAPSSSRTLLLMCAAR